MRALLIAQGNRLRRDDGVAHAVLERLDPASDVEPRAILQLTPEVAEDIAGYEMVIFIDADAGATDLSIEPINQPPPAPALTHVSRPAEVVELSRALFGFSGRAFLCRIPVDDFSPGERLSRRASALAVQAAKKLELLLGETRKTR
jgi:hydrogenase maturation protease